MDMFNPSHASQVPQPVGAQPRAEDLVRSLRFIVGEYQSFIRGFAALVDATVQWQQGASAPDEAKRWELLHRQANSLLIQHGVRPTAAVGHPVDLRYHEVVGTEAVPGMAPDQVARIVTMGYELVWSEQSKYILRRARVVASAAAHDPRPEADAT